MLVFGQSLELKLVIDHNILQLFGHSLYFIVKFFVGSFELHAFLVIKRYLIFESQDNFFLIVKSIPCICQLFLHAFSFDVCLCDGKIDAFIGLH